jgi:hypothetical protein
VEVAVSVDLQAVPSMIWVLTGAATVVGGTVGVVAWVKQQARSQAASFARSKAFEERVADLFVAGVNSDDFERRIARLFSIALRGEDFEGVVSKIVSRAFTNQLDHVLRDVAQLREDIRGLREFYEGREKAVQAALERAQAELRSYDGALSSLHGRLTSVEEAARTYRGKVDGQAERIAVLETNAKVGLERRH